MIKVNIIMKDHSMLNSVNLFKGQQLGDTIIETKSEAINYLHGERIVYFGGKYVQGRLIPNQIMHYDLYEDEDTVEKKIKDFVKNNNSYFDTNDTAEYILEYRKQLLEILK